LVYSKDELFGLILKTRMETANERFQQVVAGAAERDAEAPIQSIAGSIMRNTAEQDVSGKIFTYPLCSGLFSARCNNGETTMKAAKGKGRRTFITGILVTVLLNGVLLYALYMWLESSLPGVTALCIALLPSLAENAYHVLRRRRTDAFGLLMLELLRSGPGLPPFGVGERLLLMRESLVTGAVGAALLASLLFPKPLIYYLNRRFFPQGAERIDERWGNPYTRFIFRWLTFIWGMMLAVECMVRNLSDVCWEAGYFVRRGRHPAFSS